MATLYIERDLFKATDWKSNKSDSINKPQADYFEASPLPDYDDAMLITNGSLQAWGGALVSRKRGVPSQNGKLLNWIAYRLECRFPRISVDDIARHEVDLKVCVKSRPDPNTQIRNVANFSTQRNSDTGQWQIDLDPPKWVDTGFVTEDPEPDVWHTLEYRLMFDEGKQIFSVLSIQWDNQMYMIPAKLQSVPMQLTNWEQVASLQLQNEIYEPKSTALIEYRNGVLAWSDDRITMIPEATTRDRDSDEWLPRGKGQILVGGDFDPYGEGAEQEERDGSR